MPEPTNPSKIFRAYDVRGVFPTDINESIVENIGMAYASHMSGKAKQIIVAHDVRLSSPQLALAFIKGASQSEAKIVFAGMLPLGTALFHACKTDAELAYITASHLPAEWNGIKFFHPTGSGWMETETYALRDVYLGSSVKEPVIESKSEKIAVHDENAPPVPAKRSVKDYVQISSSGKLPVRASHNEKHTTTDPDAITANYIRHLMSKVRTQRKLRVILDCGNGAASVVAPKLFALGGFDVKALWAQPDGRFPNRSPDPHSESLSKLRELVRSERASLGIAYDGDGDRMSIVDDKGNVLSPERTAYFILSELLKSAQGPIVANVECTRLIDDIAQKFGRSVIRVPVGHTYLMDGVHANKAAFGLEVSGHYALPALVPFDDALAISYYLACILARQDKPLSELVSTIKTYPFERLNFICDDEHKFDVIGTLKAKLATKYENMNTMDGIRIDLSDGWVLIRASNTEPKIRITVEANTQEKFDQLKVEFTELMEKELKGVYKPSLFAKLSKIFNRKTQAKA